MHGSKRASYKAHEPRGRAAAGRRLQRRNLRHLEVLRISEVALRKHGSTVETGNSALYDALASLTPNANRRLAGRGLGRADFALVESEQRVSLGLDVAWH